MRVRALVQLGALLRSVAGCFRSTVGPGVPVTPGDPLDRNTLLRDSCEDLVLYQLFNRPTEEYTFVYSVTVDGNRHPKNSQVSISCREGQQEARVFAYSERPSSPSEAQSENLIMAERQVTAVCDPLTRQWKVSNRDFNQVYCGLAPPQPALFS